MKRKGARKASRSRHRMFSVIIERDAEGWYVGSVPELRGCHSQAKSLDQLLDRVREAIALCLEAKDPGSPAEFVGVQRIAVEDR